MIGSKGSAPVKPLSVHHKQKHDQRFEHTTNLQHSTVDTSVCIIMREEEVHIFSNNERRKRRVW